MESEQARELALNARLNHWPAHLGVTSDAEKIEYLAVSLDEAATWMAINEIDDEKIHDLEAEVESLQAERDNLIDELKAKLSKVTVEETLAQQIAGDNYGLSLEDGPSRQQTRGRLFPDERKAFDAGWEAAKQYLEPERLKMRRMLAAVMDAHYGGAVHHIGDGDGISSAEAAEIQEYWRGQIDSFVQSFAELRAGNVQS